MKPRARRVTIAAAVLGAAVVGVLAIVHREAVRDHVDGWRFQRTRETETITGLPGGRRPAFVRMFGGLFEQLASCSGSPVIVDSEDDYDRQALPWGLSNDQIVWQIQREPPVAAAARRDLILKVLRSNGCRIIEQCFPRRAWVVIRSSSPRPPPRASSSLLRPLPRGNGVGLSKRDKEELREALSGGLRPPIGKEP